jgi:hypothetical protein
MMTSHTLVSIGVIWCCELSEENENLPLVGVPVLTSKAIYCADVNAKRTARSPYFLKKMVGAEGLEPPTKCV